MLNKILLHYFIFCCVCFPILSQEVLGYGEAPTREAALIAAIRKAFQEFLKRPLSDGQNQGTIFFHWKITQESQNEKNYCIHIASNISAKQSQENFSPANVEKNVEKTFKKLTWCIQVRVPLDNKILLQIAKKIKREIEKEFKESGFHVKRLESIKLIPKKEENKQEEFIAFLLDNPAEILFDINLEERELDTMRPHTKCIQLQAIGIACDMTGTPYAFCDEKKEFHLDLWQKEDAELVDYEREVIELPKRIVAKIVIQLQKVIVTCYEVSFLGFTVDEHSTICELLSQISSLDIIKKHEANGFLRITLCFAGSNLYLSIYQLLQNRKIPYSTIMEHGKVIIFKK